MAAPSPPLPDKTPLRRTRREQRSKMAAAAARAPLSTNASGRSARGWPRSPPKRRVERSQAATPGCLVPPRAGRLLPSLPPPPLQPGYLSEMRGPVDGRPAVEGVLGGQVFAGRALKQRAQSRQVAVAAGAVQREAQGQQLLAREARLRPGSQRHGGGGAGRAGSGQPGDRESEAAELRATDCRHSAATAEHKGRRAGGLEGDSTPRKGGATKRSRRARAALLGAEEKPGAAVARQCRLEWRWPASDFQVLV